MAFSALKSSSALNPYDFNRRMLEMLEGGTAAQRQAVAQALGVPAAGAGTASDAASDTANDNAAGASGLSARRHWEGLRSGAESLTFAELSRILKALESGGHAIDPAVMGGMATPLSDKAFYDAVREGAENAEKLQDELQALRDRVKKEKGFIKAAFNIFSHPEPVRKAVENVAAFEVYCRENKIGFDEVARGLEAPHEKSVGATAWNKVKDFRFLVAAIGGGVVGMAGSAAGVNLTQAIPLASSVPGLFFGALPYIAVPFIGLSIFRAFSEKSIFSEISTFARFGVTMALGSAIGLGVTSAMAGYLPALDVAGAAQAVVDTAAPGAMPFSPTQYILHVIGAFACMAGIHKMAKDRLAEAGQAAPSSPAKKGFLTAAFDRASGLFVNRYTAPSIEKAGKILTAAGDMTDKTFGHFMNWVGIPAIFLMVGDTLATGGMSQFATYGGYYATVTLGMAGCAAALAATAWAYGCRGKEFKELARTASTAFSISSSAATMPVTKESLKNMGVSEKVRNSVVPLGANFNMMGTALYLGVTAACGAAMMGHDLSLFDRMTIIGTAILTAFAAPGTPSSSILFLDPVLAKIGMTPAQAQEIYKMVLPLDRVFDMGQTSLNVTGDMIVALDVERAEKKKAAQGPAVPGGPTPPDAPAP